MRGEQHADDEGSQIRLEADHFKTGGPDHQCQKDSEQHLQLAVTGPLQQLEQRGRSSGSPSTQSAQMLGHLPLEKARNATANTSCITSTPMAMRA